MTKIWQKSEQETYPKILEEYMIGKDYILDYQLIPYDIQGSKAHAKMLHTIGVLSSGDLEKLEKGLNEILEKYSAGEFSIHQDQEDGHSAIEEYLIKYYGEVGKKIHTARSRNDQILVTLRLFTLEKATSLEEKIQKLIQSFEYKISEIGEHIMPGYTHTQRAMPSSIGMWLGSYEAALKDTLVFLEAAKKINNQNPLGSAAGFGDADFGIDRDYTTELLGFEKTQENPMYCAYSRGKFEYIVMQTLSHVMLDLGKLANDLVYFSSSEFDFFTIPDSFKTGSSIMPQKKNWDIMELVRGNMNLFLGYEFQIREIYKGLFSGYNRDFQLTKEPYLQGIQLVEDTLEVCHLVIENLGINSQKLFLACSGELYATEAAYKLVKAGVPFRDAYREIGKKFI